MTKEKNKQRVNLSAVSVEIGKLWRFPAISIVLGVLSIAIALVVSYISYEHSLRMDKEHHQYYYLNEVRTLAADVAEHTDSTGEELLNSILYIWGNSKQRPADEYLCVIDKESNLILHTIHPKTVGNYVGNNTLLKCGCPETCRIKDIAKRHTDYVGGYVSSAGQKQIAAFTFVPQRGWIICIHRSESAFVKEVRAGLYPMVFGLLTVCIIFIPASLGLLTFAFNIAQRRHIKAEEAIREKEKQHQAELFHMSRLSTIGEMASGLAHELNQPLSAILSYTNACLHLIDTGERIDGDISKNLVKIDVQTKRAGEIIHRIKGFVQKRQPHWTSIDINDSIRKLIDFLDTDIRFREIELDLKLSETIPMVLADSVQVEQVIMNLIRNAIEAMESPTILEQLLTIQTSMNTDDLVEITVSDTGKGMSKDTCDQIFDSFFSTKSYGLGIGLTISRSIIEAHNGTIWAEANTNSGSIFKFTLPITQVNRHKSI